MSSYTPHSQTKTTCHLCQRPPGGWHRASCPMSKRYAKLECDRKPHPRLSPGYPIANVFDLTWGVNLKPIPLARGIPRRINLATMGRKQAVTASKGSQA